MTYGIVWDERAIDAAAGYLADDAPGLEQLLRAIDMLAMEPRPVAAAEFGSPHTRRLRVGRYRVLYEIADDTATITVIHVGRIP